MRFGRSRRLVVALAGLTLLAACGAGGQAAEETVTSFVTAAPSSVSPTSEPAASPSPSPSQSPTVSPTPSSSAVPADPNAPAQDGVPLADGFVPRKLQPGEKPRNSSSSSFDGVGWHEKWQHWFDVAKKVPFRFTGFLSGTYMLSADGPPPPGQRGARVSDRFQRSRVPMLPTVLFADASEDYRAMAKDALLEGRSATDMRMVADGGELLAYLRNAPAERGKVTPVPSLIVLDAQLPGDPQGLDAVRAIKQEHALRHIPVVALGADDDPATVSADDPPSCSRRDR